MSSEDSLVPTELDSVPNSCLPEMPLQDVTHRSLRTSPEDLIPTQLLPSKSFTTPFIRLTLTELGLAPKRRYHFSSSPNTKEEELDAEAKSFNPIWPASFHGRYDESSNPNLPLEFDSATEPLPGASDLNAIFPSQISINSVANERTGDPETAENELPVPSPPPRVLFDESIPPNAHEDPTDLIPPAVAPLAPTTLDTTRREEHMPLEALHENEIKRKRVDDDTGVLQKRRKFDDSIPSSSFDGERDTHDDPTPVSGDSFEGVFSDMMDQVDEFGILAAFSLSGIPANLLTGLESSGAFPEENGQSFHVFTISNYTLTRFQVHFHSSGGWSARNSDDFLDKVDEFNC